jgi:hypothetical protein
MARLRYGHTDNLCALTDELAGRLRIQCLATIAAEEVGNSLNGRE